MQVLALDTASPLPSVTLFARGEILEETLPGDRRASEELLPAIARCLDRASLALPDCDRIAVCSGPGSFTGLRIGLATAWGLGRAGDVPVETVPTLEALAETVRGRADRVAAVLDAGRGDVVLEVFSLEPGRALSLGPQRRLSVGEARATVAGLDVVSLPEGLLGTGGLVPEVSPSRALARAVARAPGAETLGRLQGIYSRPSAAEEKRGAP